MDKEQRKRLQSELRAKQRAALRETLPMAICDFREMFDMLDAELQSQECDHTRRLTAAWVELKGYEASTIFQWLEEHGGYCDCEILANVEDVIEEAGKA